MTEQITSPTPSPSSEASHITTEPQTEDMSIWRKLGRSNGLALAQTILYASAAAAPPSLLKTLSASPHLPAVGYRMFFTGVFGLSAYAMGPAGDVRNGTGIATAWSIGYIMLHLKKTLKRPAHPVALAMLGGSTLCAAAYGTEYFGYQD
ncbi:hypothetical protein BDV98DRAFT_556585 [Pterulicium gracile]|uniref:Uncharacterized protein n=1 Tax=Pterulicium gracile TaxID=1884261 RepID=A0A5C3Q4W6_9AGAR|nr:hypothetical protein BDV98DRAFT_556585 [Pterula gracilis]